MNNPFGLNFRDLRKYFDRKSFIALASMMVVATIATVGVIYCLHQVLAYRQISIAITAKQSVLNSYYSELLNAETGQRGYLLTGNPSYLAPYNAAVKTLPKEATTMMSYDKGQPFNRTLMEILPLTSRKLNELSQTIEAYNNQGLPAATAIVNTNQGEEDMSQLRAIISQVSVQLSHDLIANRTAATAFGVYATWISVSTLIIMLALAGLVYLLFLNAIKSERELDSAKEHFVSLASHQLRTPVAEVKSLLSLLISEDVGRLNDKQKHLLSRAEESNQRQHQIVEELLEGARANAGRMIILPKRFNVLEVINSIATELHETRAVDESRFKVEAPTEPIWIVGDPVKLRMAIGNLVDNAFKYGPSDGKVVLRVKVVSSKSTPRHLRVEVLDTGQGIDDADLPSIFDRYGRARAAISRGIEGTGLGLYLTRIVVELHHGTISVASTKDKGTLFSILLPMEHTQ